VGLETAMRGRICIPFGTTGGWLWDEDEDVDVDMDLGCTGYRPDDDVQDLPRSHRRTLPVPARQQAKFNSPSKPSLH
jgi:hypothetical protein